MKYQPIDGRKTLRSLDVWNRLLRGLGVVALVVSSASLTTNSANAQEQNCADRQNGFTSVSRSYRGKSAFWNTQCHVPPLRIVAPNEGTDNQNVQPMQLLLTPAGFWEVEYHIFVGPKKAGWRLVFDILDNSGDRLFQIQTDEFTDRADTRFIVASGRSTALAANFDAIRKVERRVKNLRVIVP